MADYALLLAVIGILITIFKIILRQGKNGFIKNSSML